MKINGNIGLGLLVFLNCHFNHSVNHHRVARPEVSTADSMSRRQCHHAIDSPWLHRLLITYVYTGKIQHLLYTQQVRLLAVFWWLLYDSITFCNKLVNLNNKAQIQTKQPRSPGILQDSILHCLLLLLAHVAVYTA